MIYTDMELVFVVRGDIWQSWVKVQKPQGRCMGGGAKAYKEGVTKLWYMQKKKNAGRNIQPKHYRG